MARRHWRGVRGHLFRALAHEGTITGHGGKGALLFAAEALTNDAGELQIAKQEFSTQPFFLATVLENPQMTLFKPGYATETLTNSRRIIAERQDVTSWMYDGQTVRLKRARTDAELAQAAHWAAEYARHGVDPGHCSWKRIPRNAPRSPTICAFAPCAAPCRTSS